MRQKAGLLMGFDPYRQIEKRRERRKCFDADNRMSCQKPRLGYAVRSKIHAGTSSQRSACDPSNIGSRRRRARLC